MRFKRLIISIIITSFIFQYALKISSYAETESNNINIENNTENYINQDESKNELNNINAENTENNMKIYSEAAILIEAKTGEVLYEKESHTRKYPASTTKILTAIIALEKCKLDETQVASQTAVNSIKSGYSTANIQVGETFTIGELLDVLMIHSANEAANIIAEHISGSISEFAKLMNEKAKEIGCLDSNFVNPNGVHNENHYSTAYDLAIIAKYCMKNQKFREIVTKMECSLPTTEQWQEERKFKNTNSLLLENNRYYYPYCNGIKTGFTTPAKNCLISSSNKNGFELISVILHAEATEEGLSARYLDTINLFEYGYNNYNLEDILEEYDLIEYPTVTEQISNANPQTVLTGIVESDNKKNSNEIIKGWTKIICGIIIIFLVTIYYFVKNFKKNKENVRDRLYNFKLNDNR